MFEQYRNLKNLRIAGIHIHIGSPVYEIEPYVMAVKKIVALIDRLAERGHKIEWFDLGGGFAVNYERPDQALPITKHAEALIPLLEGKPYRIALEPGRYIAGNAGILLTRVLYRKMGGEKKFVIVDAGMNDLIRPTLYESYHHVWPAQPDASNVPRERSINVEPHDGEIVDVVGPICESGDYLAKNRLLPKTKRGDLLAVFTAGAYGFAMSSNYNNRPRAPEILVGRQQLQNHSATRNPRRSGSAGANVTQPNFISYGSTYSQSDRDEEHLRILAICHYIAGAIAILFSCFFIIYIVMGIAIVSGKMPMGPPTTPTGAAPIQQSSFGYIFIVMGGIAVSIGWSVGAAIIYSGICLGRKRRRMFSLIVAAISCAFVPIGTVLGIFTLLVLLRDSVRMSYAQTSG